MCPLRPVYTKTYGRMDSMSNAHGRDLWYVVLEITVQFKAATDKNKEDVFFRSPHGNVLNSRIFLLSGP
jgi:hypothetical protein